MHRGHRWAVFSMHIEFLNLVFWYKLSSLFLPSWQYVMRGSPFWGQPPAQPCTGQLFTPISECFAAWSRPAQISKLEGTVPVWLHCNWLSNYLMSRWPRYWWRRALTSTPEFLENMLNCTWAYVVFGSTCQPCIWWEFIIVNIFVFAISCDTNQSGKGSSQKFAEACELTTLVSFSTPSIPWNERN